MPSSISLISKNNKKYSPSENKITISDRCKKPGTLRDQQPGQRIPGYKITLEETHSPWEGESTTPKGLIGQAPSLLSPHGKLEPRWPTSHPLKCNTSNHEKGAVLMLPLLCIYYVPGATHSAVSVMQMPHGLPGRKGILLSLLGRGSTQECKPRLPDCGACICNQYCGQSCYRPQEGGSRNVPSLLASGSPLHQTSPRCPHLCVLTLWSIHS